MGIVGSSGSTVVVGSSEDEVDELGSVSGGVVGIETVDSIVVVVESSLDAMAMSAQFLYSSWSPQPMQPLLLMLVFHHIWRTQYWHETPAGRRTLRLTVVG